LLFSEYSSSISTYAAVAEKLATLSAFVIKDSRNENPAVKPAIIPNLAGIFCTIYRITIASTGNKEESAVATIEVNLYTVLSR
jgi:hypothetical protein